jgi:hypothetical protein
MREFEKRAGWMTEAELRQRGYASYRVPTELPDNIKDAIDAYVAKSVEAYLAKRAEKHEAHN